VVWPARLALGTCCLLLAHSQVALADPPRTPPGIPPTAVDKLADTLYSFRWGPYRTLFMVTGQGVIVADPISTEAAHALRGEIARISNEKVKFVVYSHSHWDHAAGARVFKDEGAKIVAQEKCAANMRETPNPDVLPPDITFKDRYSVRLGKHRWDLYYLGPSHDNCLVMMIPRPYRILYVVDVLNPPYGYSMPWNPLLPDDHIYNFIPFFRSLDTLARREGITQITGGHLSVMRDEAGKPVAAPALGPAAAIADRLRFWEVVLGAAEAEWDKGTYSEVIPDKIDLNRFSDVHGYDHDEMWLLFRRLGSYFAGGR
jgi:glyoxylase-like metal-dependent hydrolase (beta-lactamase superfamily II)